MTNLVYSFLLLINLMHQFQMSAKFISKAVTWWLHSLGKRETVTGFMCLCCLSVSHVVWLVTYPECFSAFIAHWDRLLPSTWMNGSTWANGWMESLTEQNGSTIVSTLLHSMTAASHWRMSHHTRLWWQGFGVCQPTEQSQHVSLTVTNSTSAYILQLYFTQQSEEDDGRLILNS